MKCQEWEPDSHGYPSVLLSQKHVEKYYPILVSVEARGITFPRWQRKQSAQCPLQMAVPHPAPPTKTSAGKEVRAAPCLGKRALRRRWEYNSHPSLAVPKLLPQGCFSAHPCKSPWSLDPSLFFLASKTEYSVTTHMFTHPGSFIFNSWLFFFSDREDLFKQESLEY